MLRKRQQVADSSSHPGNLLPAFNFAEALSKAKTTFMQALYLACLGGGLTVLPATVFFMTRLNAVWN